MDQIVFFILGCVFASPLLIWGAWLCWTARKDEGTAMLTVTFGTVLLGTMLTLF